MEWWCEEMWKKPKQDKTRRLDDKTIVSLSHTQSPNYGIHLLKNKTGNQLKKNKKQKQKIPAWENRR